MTWLENLTVLASCLSFTSQENPLFESELVPSKLTFQHPLEVSMRQGLRPGEMLSGWRHSFLAKGKGPAWHLTYHIQIVLWNSLFQACLTFHILENTVRRWRKSASEGCLESFRTAGSRALTLSPSPHYGPHGDFGQGYNRRQILKTYLLNTYPVASKYYGKSQRQDPFLRVHKPAMERSLKII